MPTASAKPVSSAWSFDPPSSSGEIFSPVASSSTRGPDTAIEAPSSITTKSERQAFQVGSP